MISLNLCFGSISILIHDSLEIEENELNTPDIVIDKNVIIKELPQKKYAKRSTATACRELLNEIKSLTYLITDEEVLDQLKKDLSISLKKLEVSVPRNDGIIKLSNGTVRKENFFSKQRCRLPKARSRKVHASGRLGIKAEQSKIASINRVQSSDIRAKKEGSVVTEEIAPFDSSTYDVPLQTENITNITSSGLVHHKRKNDDVEVTGEIPARGTHKKRRKLIFSEREKYIILSKEMLTDESINLAMNMIHEQFPQIGGLTDSSIGKLQQFDIVPPTAQYIQILHCEPLHWVCVANMSNLKSDNHFHMLYDSLAATKAREDVVDQVVDYSSCLEKKLIIKRMPVQQQQNGVDCGLFALAFATSLAFGEDPCKNTYDVKRLRPHLLECLKKQQLVPFPTSTDKITRPDAKSFIVELYCSCRRPWRNRSDPSYDMAQCERCQIWYHQICENIPRTVFRGNQKHWFCQSCTKS